MYESWVAPSWAGSNEFGAAWMTTDNVALLDAGDDGVAHAAGASSAAADEAARAARIHHRERLDRMRIKGPSAVLRRSTAPAAARRLSRRRAQSARPRTEVAP